MIAFGVCSKCLPTETQVDDVLSHWSKNRKIWPVCQIALILQGMRISNDHPSMSSLAIHGNSHQLVEYAHLLPIFSSSTFTFDDAQQGMDRFSGKEPGFMYSRFGNPTVKAAEELVAGLEAYGVVNPDGTPLQLKALLHASGQSAMATMLLSNLSAGDTVLSHPSLYG